MDFFDIFIFNNVKSCHKIKFCQQNKTDSDIKLLPLCRLYPYRKPRWAEVGQTYIWYKAFLYALVLTIDELRKFNCKSKTKQCRTPHEVYYIQPSLASDNSLFVVKSAFYILTLAWGFRRCSFRLTGQCEGLSIVERVTEWLYAFFLMYQLQR